MGQKVNPHGIRVGVIKGWDSVWYANKDNFSAYLVEDNKLRKYLKKELFNAGISNISISRSDNKVKVTLRTAKPGLVIGKQGSEIKRVTAILNKMTGKNCSINIQEVKRVELESQLVAEDIAKQLENRVAFRRAMKQAMSRAMKMGAKGIKTQVSGRLGGADMARTEHYNEGTIPLQTLRADIDYGFAEADTTFGKLGVKVWIYKGEVLPGREVKEEKASAPRRNNKREGSAR